MSTGLPKEPKSVNEHIDLAKLRQAIAGTFNKDELRTLTFDLDIEYENLSAQTKDGLARELVANCERKNILQQLIDHCAQVRPQINWHSFIRSIDDGEPPFKGLYFFDEPDADLFFGQENLIVELVSFLKGNSFLAVVGASGSGKSSLVRAGLIPAIKHKIPLVDGSSPPVGSNKWMIYTITPTARPIEALAEPLTRDVESLTAFESLIDDLKRSPRSLHLFSQRAVNRSNTDHLLLVIDQFEELFTLCHDEDSRKFFIDNLMTAVAPETGGPTKVVITLRADFYHYCAQYGNLRGTLETQQKFIGQMQKAQLEMAIKEPALRRGISFEDGLIDLILGDVGDEPGALPLLSHALLETWKARNGKVMTYEGYTTAGGIQGAIGKTADKVYKYHLTTGQQAIARNIFLRLIEVGADIQETRRRATLAELVPRSEDTQSVQIVLNILAKERLITLNEDSAEIAHEALIRKWPLLQQWIEEDREGLRIQNRLSEAAQTWDDLNRANYVLYRGLQLEQALDWATSHSEQLTSLEEDFLKESNAAKKAARRRERVIRAVILIAALTVAVLGGLLGVTQRQLAKRNEAAATSAVVIAQSNLLLSGIVSSYAKEDFETAGLLFIELWDRDPGISERFPEEFDRNILCGILDDLGLTNDLEYEMGVVVENNGTVEPVTCNPCTRTCSHMMSFPEQEFREFTLEVGTITNIACQHISRNLTLEEWERYIQSEPYSQTCPNIPKHASAIESDN